MLLSISIRHHPNVDCKKIVFFVGSPAADRELTVKHRKGRILAVNAPEEYGLLPLGGADGEPYRTVKITVTLFFLQCAGVMVCRKNNVKIQCSRLPNDLDILHGGVPCYRRLHARDRFQFYLKLHRMRF
jgi:ABC-type Na+ transport system ATPase subunit NatA